MKKKILENLINIELQHGVKIILAVESGSRAWGVPSESSDYDVRFLYLQNINWYLSIDDQRDVIELPIDDQLDMHGWELRKALRLLRKANPHLLEWLHSSVVYYQHDKSVALINAVAEAAFSSKAALFHYVNMARRNHLDFLQGEEVKIKKYFYVLRPILICQWIERHNCFPALDFQSLVENTIDSDSLKQSVLSLIQRKKAGIEFIPAYQFMNIHQFIQDEIERIFAYAKSLADQPVNLTQQLDLVFRQAFTVAWAACQSEG